MQVTGRFPGCPEANTIPDGEGDPADGKADAVKAVAWKSTQRAHAGLSATVTGHGTSSSGYVSAPPACTAVTGAGFESLVLG